MIFIDDTGIVGTQIAQIRQARMRKGYTLERFLYDFLISLIDDDLLYLSALEKKIAGMEERILEREDKEFNHEMLRMKKEISRMHRYYSQMAGDGEMLHENEMDFFGGERGNVLWRVYGPRGQTPGRNTGVKRVRDAGAGRISVRDRHPPE